MTNSERVSWRSDPDFLKKKKKAEDPERPEDLLIYSKTAEVKDEKVAFD